MSDTPREPMAELAARLDVNAVANWHVLMATHLERSLDGYRQLYTASRVADEEASIAWHREAAAALRDTSARPTDEALRALRDEGWMVAVHNDYTQGGERFTFWLLTKGARCVKGEGHTDDEALAQIRAALLTQENSDG